jgi:hypothetical protein
MADVFVSYKKEDVERVRTIVMGLRSEGVDVWWDQDIQPGATWDETVASHLHNAKCVVVVWSTLSVSAPWVKEEAGHGKARGALAPVRIHDVEPPIGFTLLQCGDLRKWKGDPDDQNFKDFVGTVRKILRGEKVATLSAPFIKRRRNWAIGILLGLVALIAAAALAVSMLRPQPVESEAVKNLETKTKELEAATAGPSAAEQEAWAKALSTRSREGYELYLGTYPQGRFQPEAQAKLATCRTIENVSYSKWEEKSNVLGVTQAGSFGTREDAVMSANDRGRAAADVRCNALAEGAGAENVRTKAEPVLGAPMCNPMGPSAFTCSKQFWVTCTGEVPTRSKSEVCD